LPVITFKPLKKKQNSLHIVQEKSRYGGRSREARTDCILCWKDEKRSLSSSANCVESGSGGGSTRDSRPGPEAPASRDGEGLAGGGSEEPYEGDEGDEVRRLAKNTGGGACRVNGGGYAAFRRDWISGLERKSPSLRMTAFSYVVME
jgi:hypothetical protein